MEKKERKIKIKKLLKSFLWKFENCKKKIFFEKFLKCQKKKFIPKFVHTFFWLK